MLGAVRTSRPGLLIGCWLLLTVLVHAAVSPGEIATPRPGSWVVDQCSLLTTEDRAELNALGDSIHTAHANAGLFIVAIPTTGGANHRKFATQLLNSWGPGGTLKSGVIVMLALQDRRAELVLGDTLFAQRGTTENDRIMREQIVAAMKRGDARGALLGSARACAETYFRGRATGARQASADDTTMNAAAPNNAPAPVATRPASVESEVPRTSVSRRPDGDAARNATWRLEKVTAQRDSSGRSATATDVRASPGGSGRSAPRKTAWIAGILLAVLALSAVAAATGLGFVLFAWLGPRRCRNCRSQMQPLSHAGKLAHLTERELTEEKLGSVRHDVWCCLDCATLEKIARTRWFTGISECPSCHARAERKTTRTVTAATEHSTGLAETTHDCAACGHHFVTLQTLATLSSVSSSSSDSGFSSSDSSSSSSSSSSDSSSSGGGSSGSW